MQIKTTELIDTSGHLQEIILEDFFDQLHRNIFPDDNNNNMKTGILCFLKGIFFTLFSICFLTFSCFVETFPDFEIVLDESNNISSQDSTYVYSLLLFYSCVIQENKFFQKCCKSLDTKQQLGIVKYFNYMSCCLSDQKITKEIVRKGITEATSVFSPPVPFLSVKSPLRTPKKPNISPPTPSKQFLENKLKELKHVKTQLENERYEKNILEIEVKENCEKITNLGRQLSLVLSLKS